MGRGPIGLAGVFGEYIFNDWSDYPASQSVAILLFGVVPGAIYAVMVGAQPVAAFFKKGTPMWGPDPIHIVERSLQVAQTGNIFTIDPPLRYVPTATGILLSGAGGDYVFASSIVHLISAVAAYVVFPFALALLATGIVDIRAGVITLLAFYTVRALHLGVGPYFTSRWHYAIPLAIAFATVHTLHLSVEGESGRLAVHTGLGMGVVGLQEFVFGLILAGGATVVYLSRRQTRQWVICGAVGSVFGATLLLAPAAVNHALSLTAGSSAVHGRAAIDIATGTLTSLTALGNLLVVSMAVFVLAARRVVGSCSDSVDVVIVVAVVIWLLTKPVGLSSSVGHTAQFLLFNLLLAANAAYLVRFVSKIAAGEELQINWPSSPLG